jgi:hypothetical protein
LNPPFEENCLPLLPNHGKLPHGRHQIAAIGQIA